MINWFIILCSLIFMFLGFLVAWRAKQQCGFLSPIGFMLAVLLHRLCFLATLPMKSRLAGKVDRDQLQEAVKRLSEDDRLFYMSLEGHASGIWCLGAIFLMLCGLLDLKVVRGVSPGRSRLLLIIIGTLLILVSAFYPTFMTLRFTP